MNHTTPNSAPRQSIPEIEYFRRINEIKSWREIEEYAKELTERTGLTYLPCDYGEYGYHPRYEAIAVPRIGDSVSKGFNGDCYPEGEIVSISSTFKKITTSTGVSFYRVKQTGAWKSDGTWWLVRGHHSTRNPSF